MECDWGYEWDFGHCDCVPENLPPNTYCYGMGACGDGYMPNFELCTCEEIPGYEYHDDAPNFVCPDMPACGYGFMPDFDQCICIELDWDNLPDNYDAPPPFIDCYGL